MPYSKEEYVAAIEIAERVVIRERRVARYSQTKTPNCIINHSREMQGSSMEKLLDNPLAEKLLPQARIIVAEREARESVLEIMTLGRMKDALGYLSVYLVSGVTTADSDTPFTTEDDNNNWREFLEALEKGNKKKIVDSLYALVTSAHAELLFTSLPNIESRYHEVL